MKSLKIKFLMSFLFLSPVTKASVSLQTGAWHWDTIAGEIALHFNSRSLHQGWWGQGWCSEIDATLKDSGDGTLSFEVCSSTEKIIHQHDKNHIYEIKYQESYYFFDQNHRLIRVKRPQKNITLDWQGFKLEKINIRSSESHKSYAVHQKTIAGQSKIIGLQANHEKRLTFIYENDLLKSTPLESYQYDQFDNLHKIDFKDSKLSNLTVVYDRSDRVQTVSSDNHCETKYGFEEFKNDREIILFSKVFKNCADLQAQVLKVVTSKFSLTQENTITLTEVKETYL